MDLEKVIGINREIVADIIIKLNLIESKLKDIITKYIASEKTEFVRDILLNNLIVNMSSKVKALQYIIGTEGLEVSKDFKKSLMIIMTKRNMIAHADGLLDPNIDVDIDVDWNPDGSYIYPIFEVETRIPTFENGKINYSEINKVHEDFNKYFEIANTELNSIKGQLGIEVYEDPEGLL